MANIDRDLIYRNAFYEMVSFDLLYITNGIKEKIHIWLNDIYVTAV